MKITKLPPATKSDMTQQVGWRAARKGITVEEFKEDQHRLNRERKASTKNLLKKCPSWHTHEYVRRAEGDYKIFWCKDCKDYRAVEVY